MVRLFTSESVSEGHPDKICDGISDAILDDIIFKDPQARVAIEVSVTKNFVGVFGEVSTSASYDVEKIVSETIRDIGYNDASIGFSAETCTIRNFIKEQSSDIFHGVFKDDLGAGDQGIVFGSACVQTSEYMPLSILTANFLMRSLSFARKEGVLPYLYPDSKCQVTVEYDDQWNPIRFDSIVISSHYDAGIKHDDLVSQLKTFCFNSLPTKYLQETRFYINPLGRFCIGGPEGDSGLTGRKIIVDTYGGWGRHGGGAFSGKDPTKIDRSAAYMVRYVAKNIVAAGIADDVDLQIAYVIGGAKPISISLVSSVGLKIKESKLLKIITEVFDFSPKGIIDVLDLRRPIYRQLSSYGHFGREDLDLAWEKLDKVDLLKDIAFS